MLIVSVFEHDPDFLLLYAPDDVAIVEVPDLEPPFTKESVIEAFRREGLEARISQDFIGRELRQVIIRRRNEARNERAQKANLEQSARAAEARGSIDPALREKADNTSKHLRDGRMRTAMREMLGRNVGFTRASLRQTRARRYS